MQAKAPRLKKARTPFIGRTRERRLLLDGLLEGTGLFVLTGPSGIGKTRLAGQVAHDAAARFDVAGGIWFCSLGGCTSAVDVEGAVARTLGIPMLHGESLARAIRNRGPTLLLLDNLDAAADVVGETIGSWLDDCPELQMIATSIVPIRVEGEHCLEIGPLESEDAVALYLERARRASAGHAFSESDAPAVEELVGRLDRSPLAIELAAARVRVLPPRTLLAKFDERFELLQVSSRGRHGSLIQALTLTWELLTERERMLLSRLSVFEGGFTYEAAVTLLSDDSDKVGILDLLDDLRSKTLLHVDDSEPPRFLLFESVKDHALRALSQSGHREETLRRHTDYFLAKGEEQLGHIEGERTLEAFQWLKAERDNILAVHLRNLHSDPAFSARAGLALAPILLLEGEGVSKAGVWEAILDAARRSGDPRLVIGALSARSNALKDHGLLEKGLADSMEALALAREIGDRTEEARQLVQAASLHVWAADHDRALPLLELADRIAREEGDPFAEGKGLLVQGELSLGRLAPAEADSYFSRALRIFHEHGFVRREGLASAFVGIAKMGQGRFREARRALLHALNVSREMANRTFEANTTGNLGCVEMDAGLLGEAERYLSRSLELHREVGNRIGEGIALANLGIVALEREELDLAESRLSEAEGVLMEFGVRGSLTEVLSFLAVLEAKRGRPKEARRCLDDALSYLSSIDPISGSRLEFVEGIIEIAEARRLASTRPDEVEALVGRARSRLESASAEHGVEENFGVAFRILEQELGRWASGVRDAGIDPSESGLRVGPGADWFELPGLPRVKLNRRNAIRRVMDALVEKRLGAPGTALDVHELFDLGWPGESLHPEIALRRVYVGIAELRKLGLTDVLLHQTDGYLLAPRFPVMRVTD